MPRAQSTVVPHPVYDMFADGRITKEDARERLRLPQDVPVLLFFGIVREYKGLRDLLKAMPKVRARLGEVKLVIAGEFWENKESYLGLIEGLGIRDSVVIEDRYIPNEEVALYFSAADVLVAPHRRMTGSGAVQMARGFGVPVVGLSSSRSRGAAGEKQSPLDRADTLAEAVVEWFSRGREGSPRGPAGDGRDNPAWRELVTTLEGMVEPAR